MTQTYLNGTLLDEAEASLSIEDRGFRYGDGVFETILVKDGLPYLWDYHLERLNGGLAALRIALETQDLIKSVLRLLSANAAREGLLRIQVSRGTGGRGYLPAPGASTLVMQTLPSPLPAPDPMTLWLSSFEKISPKALPVHFKLAQGLNSTLARMEAAEHGCGEALLLSHDGHISEASGANIFWRKADRLYTPSLATGALAGVMRRRIFELSPWPVVEGLFTLDALAHAEEVVLTNCATLATAVTGLLPNARQWQSLPLASEINRLINLDIEQFSAALRESLASG